jgi:glycosyltransferase involved in cell wall biosynthesis
MRKRKVAIASVLKPVDDPRMFRKMAGTLAGSGQYEVTVFGFPGPTANGYPSVRVIPHAGFARIGLRRLLVPFHISIRCLRLKPDLLIINTHELMMMAVFLKVLLRLRIVYDIRENYRMNLLHTRSFPGIVRHVLAGWVRLKEEILTRWFDHFLLAEEVYRSELRFLRNREVTVIENKAIPISSATIDASPLLNFVFTGTLADSTGVFKAIEFVQRLHDTDGNLRLAIVGRCALGSDRTRLIRLAETNPWLTLQIQRDPVPHEQIEHAIAAADFGLICYPHSRHTVGRVPTKLFEYMAGGLPFLLEAGPAAKARARGYSGCIAVDDLNTLAPAEALALAKGLKTRFPRHPEALWAPEGQKLLTLIASLI